MLDTDGTRSGAHHTVCRPGFRGCGPYPVSVVLFLVSALLFVGAGALAFGARRDRVRWEDHRRQVQRMRAWEASRVGRPFDQDAQPMPQLDSPYARPASENPPALPPRPGQARHLWAAVAFVCALLVLAAAIAASR